MAKSEKLRAAALAAMKSDQPIERLWQSLIGSGAFQNGNKKELDTARHLFFAGAVALVHLLGELNEEEQVDELMQKIWDEIEVYNAILRIDVAAIKAQREAVETKSS